MGIYTETLVLLVLTTFGHQSSMMHHLLGNASDVYTGATESPLGARGSWLDKVGESDFLAKGSGAACGGNTARTTADDEKIVFVAVTGLLIHLH